MSTLQNFYDEINSRISLNDLANRLGLTQVSQEGDERRYRPPCHDSQSGTSFGVHDANGYHCFSCGDVAGHSPIGLYLLVHDRIKTGQQQRGDWHRAAVEVAGIYGITVPGQWGEMQAGEVLSRFRFGAPVGDEPAAEKIVDDPNDIFVGLDLGAAEQPIYESTVWALMDEYVSICHRQLMADSERGRVLRAMLLKGWNITEETIRKFRIGYSPTEGWDDVAQVLRSRGYTTDDLLATGLWRDGKTANTLEGTFQGRVVYPYLSAGEPRYMIGRAVDGKGAMSNPDLKDEWLTPDWDRKAKYKKLPVGAKNSKIHPCVKNVVFGWPDKSPPQDGLLLATEGVTDAITSMMSGLNVASPVTTSYQDCDFPLMATAARRAKKFIVCNDQEENKAGESGARKIAIYMEQHGVPTYFATLPRTAGQSKVDVAEYIRDHGADDFRRVLDRAVRFPLWQITSWIRDDDDSATKEIKAKEVASVISTLGDIQQAEFGERAQKVLGLGKRAWNGLLKANKPAPDAAPAIADVDHGEEEPEWVKGLVRHPVTKTVMPVFANVCTILRHDQRFPRVWSNSFDLRVYQTKADGKSSPILDADMRAIRETLSENWGLHTLGKEIVEDAVMRVADGEVKNPPVEWLKSLKWDGTPRIGNWLITAAGAEDTALHKAYSKRFLVQAVARLLNPGCKADCILLLVGRQGAKKSTLFDVLGGDWFVDTSVNTENKDHLLTLYKAWICEYAEMASLRKNENEPVKAFLSRRVDHFRPPYGRADVEFKRHTVFAGTTNDDECLRNDSTGSRRWWVVRTGDDINVDWIRQHREQLWAEARVEYESGAQWWLLDQEEADREDATVDFLEDDPWLIPIRVFLSGKAQITMADLVEGLKDKGATTDKKVQWRLASILKQHFGWTKKQVKNSVTRVTERVWVPESPAKMIGLHQVRGLKGAPVDAAEDGKDLAQRILDSHQQVAQGANSQADLEQIIDDQLNA